MKKYQVSAYFSKDRIDLKTVKNTFSGNQIRKKEGSFLLIELAEGEFMYIKDYGGIVFFGVEEGKQKSLLENLNTSSALALSECRENLLVIDGHDSLEFGFDELKVDRVDLDIIHIVCLNLCQSVALFYYKGIADLLTQQSHVYTKELEAKGKVSLGRKKLLKFIGSTLNIKNKISENLFVFDTPMIAWEDKKISKIDARLNEELEIKYRYNAIKEQLNIVKENLDLFKDLNLHQHSSLLEWIIIWLILFEVIHVIIDQFILN